MIRMQRIFVTVSVLGVLLSLSAGLGWSQDRPSEKTFTISGSVGIAGVRMQGLPGDPVSDNNGFYTVEVPPGWTGLVRPAKEGYTFGPPARQYVPVKRDYTDENFQANRLSFTISGSTGVAGVAMKGFPGAPITNPSGQYSVMVEYGWKGTVSPVKEGYEFRPPARVYPSVTRDDTNEDYQASILTFTISGNVGIAGVVMKGLPGDPVTDPRGYYTAEVAYGWSGTVTPTKEGYEFEPRARVYHRLIHDSSDEDYRAEMVNYLISGSVGVGVCGVRMEGLPGNVLTTPPGGRYEAVVPYGWSGDVVPKKDGFAFEPARRSYERVTGHRRNEDYQARPETVVISDVVQVEPEGPLEGVTVSAEPGDASDITDFQGRFTIRVPYGWSGQLKLTKEGYDFSDQLRYTNVTSHLIDGERTSALAEPVIPVPQVSAMQPQPVVRAGEGEVLVIPTSEVDPKVVVQIKEDMQVMLQVLREKLSEPRMIRGVLPDYGDFFGGQSSEALYVEDYGVLFVIKVDFPFSFFAEEPIGEQPGQAVDPVWQRAREKLYAPPGGRGYGRGSTWPEAEGMSFEQFKEDLVRALRHATNIRHVTSDKAIVLTVIAQDQGGYRYYGYRGSGGEYGGAVYGGSSRSVSGRSFGPGAGSTYSHSEVRSRGTGTRGSRTPVLDSRGNVKRDAFGNVMYYARPAAAAPTVLTMRTTKAYIDAFVTGEIKWEEFRSRVKIFSY